MMKKTIKDLDVKGKRVLMRADFNVPLEDGEITSDFRIRATLPSIRYLLDRDVRLVICSHLGRPGGEVKEELRLDPVAKRLGELLDADVQKVDDSIGRQVERTIDGLEAGDVLLLENTRFHKGEKQNDPVFAKKLAYGGELYVDDAFATAHRAHASTVGVAQYLPAVAGLLMARELETLGRARSNPPQPLVAVFGGAKISGKIDLLERFMDQLESLLTGGGIANTLLKARGYAVGDSLVEVEAIDEAKRILDQAGDKLHLPVDVIVADSMEEDAQHRCVSVNDVPERWRILDIGPETVEAYKIKLSEAKMVLWNGPLGVFEMQPYAQGTFAIARVLAGLEAETITGGGETAAAVYQAGVQDDLSHVSTGGGAFMAFMQGEELPAVEVLLDNS